jgi:microcystin-dependent protein
MGSVAEDTVTPLGNTSLPGPIGGGNNVGDFTGANVETLTESQLPIIDLNENDPLLHPFGKMTQLPHKHKFYYNQDGTGNNSNSGAMKWDDNLFFKETEEKKANITFAQIGNNQPHNNKPATYYVYYIQRVK